MGFGLRPDLFRQPVQVPVGKVPAFAQGNLPVGGNGGALQSKIGGEFGGSEPAMERADEGFGLPIESRGPGGGWRIGPQPGQFVQRK